MTHFQVIGAGLSGLFAAAVLREQCAGVIEAQASLPNNHAALLRFRSSIVGDALNIPFRQVKVIKAVQSIGNPVADAISYSLKTTGTARLRSLITAEGKVENRFIAPESFIELMRRKITCSIWLGNPWKPNIINNKGPFVSTLPMPILMKMLGYETDLEFRHITGYVQKATLRNCDLCATVYIPDRSVAPYRASITGDQLILEYAVPNDDTAGDFAHVLHSNKQSDLTYALSLFGLNHSHVAQEHDIKKQAYAKILPVNDEARKRFMLWATEHHNIYSFGRFATWRPGLLMDDLVHDLTVIQRLACNGIYEMRKR